MPPIVRTGDAIRQQLDTKSVLLSQLSIHASDKGSAYLLSNLDEAVQDGSNLQYTPSTSALSVIGPGQSHDRVALVAMFQ